MISSTASSRLLLLRQSRSVIGRRSLSIQGEAAVCRLKDALEQYRVQNYQQEIPTRFKKEMVNQCSRVTASHNGNAVEGIEHLLSDIGIMGKGITHDDVECIVEEMGSDCTTETIQADKILSKIL